MIKTKNRLGKYLTVTAGASCAASVASGSVVFYGEGGAIPNGIRVGSEGGRFITTNDPYVGFGVDTTGGRGNSIAFSQGDLSVNTSFSFVYYTFSDFIYGAISGDQNFANIDFDGNGIYESVAQFNFDGQGGGFLVAIATNNVVDPDNPTDLSTGAGAALSISDGIDRINAASVPEPSSLSLLALGAVGLATRRNRKKAA